MSNQSELTNDSRSLHNGGYNNSAARRRHRAETTPILARVIIVLYKCSLQICSTTRIVKKLFTSFSAVNDGKSGRLVRFETAMTLLLRLFLFVWKFGICEYKSVFREFEALNVISR
jgi:hypothetical protein